MKTSINSLRNMHPKNKFLHTVFVLNHINDYCEENPETQDVIIRCGDGDVPCNSLFLAAISNMLKDYLKDIQNTYQEPLVLAPSLRIHEVNTFFRYDQVKSFCKENSFLIILGSIINGWLN